MAEIDPRIRQFEQEAAKTLAAMKRSRQTAEAFEAQAQRGQASRSSLDQRVRQEVAKDRIRAETVVGGRAADQAAARKTKTSLQEQSRATRDAAREKGRMTRLNDQARASEKRLERQTTRTTRALLSREDALRRYGPYAGGRFLERQADRYYGVPAAGGAGGGGRVPPPAPPGGTAGPPGGGSGGGPRFNAVLAEEQKNLKALEGRLAGSTRSHQRLIQVQASGSNVLRRHGALTTEFIQAAARGEVTIRELGFQTAATIGKFGGWITAGAVLYGALGAVQQMGRGALDAYDGVNQLQRVVDNVDTSKARKGFSELADEFQLPVGDVTEGVYEIGKVFHDQNTALEASKALLYSVKVGELDTATAGRYLIAITNAYNLSAQDLNKTFDKFNQLQNQYGVSIKGVESATARAAGSFVNAGGSLDYLISLIGTAARVTGAAPERIGTALQRAPSFTAKPKNQDELRSFGIDPEQDIEAIFEQAFEIAKQASGTRRRELAQAIFGGQYGAYIGTPLLRQFDLFRKIQKDVADSQGSGARELARVKASPEEQLKNIGTQLERLGVGLAESGLISILAGSILALDDLLRLANSLVATFNELPDPLKNSLALMVQLGLAARLLSRLNLGDSVAPPGREVGPLRTFGGAALGGGDRRDARLIRKGLFDERTALEDERTRISDQAREQSSRAVLADERAVQEQKRLITLQKNSAGNEKAIADSKRNVTAYVQEANVSREQALRLSLDEEAKARRLNEVNRSIGRTRGRFGGLNVDETLRAARQRGPAAYPTSFGVPTTSRPGQYPPAARPPTYGAVIPAPGVPVKPIDLSRDLAKQEGEMRKATQTAERSNRRLLRLRPAAAKFGNAFNRVIGNMGTLLFAGFIVGFFASELTKAAEGVGKRFEGISQGVKNAAAQAKKLESLRQEADAGRGVDEFLTDYFTGGSVDLVAKALSGGTIDTGFESIADVRRRTAEVAAARFELIAREQREARRAGEPVPFRYVSDISKDIQKLKSGDVPTARARELLARYREELARSMESIGQAAGSQKDQRQRLQAARSELNQRSAETAGPEGLRAALERLKPEEVQEQLESEITQAGLFGGLTKDRLRRARTVYGALQSRFAGARDPESIQALAEARSTFFDGVEKTVQEELDDALNLARTPEQRNRAYTQAFQSLNRAFAGGDRKALGQQQRRVQNLRRQLRDAQGTEGLGDVAPGVLGDAADLLGIGDLKIGSSPERLKKLQQQLKSETGALKGLREDRKQRLAFLRQIRTELRRQQYEENSALREARTELKASRTADPLKQVQIRLSALNKEVGLAIEVYGKGSKEVLDLLQQRQEALAQQAQDQVNLIEARGSLRAAGLGGEGNETAKARVELQTLRAKLGFIQSNASRFDPAEILQIRAEIQSAQIDLAEQVEQEAEQLALAAIDLRIARAEAGGNSVRSARLQVVRSRATLRQADTPLERKEGRADLIGRRAALRDAASQRAIEDIQFQADIGKLTLDEQISAYKRILSTMKLTRDTRRDLRRRVYQLGQESEDEDAFNLKVGDIRLPTIYDIRRAIGEGGVSSRSQAYTDNSQNVMNVTVQGGDTEKFMQLASDTFNRHNRNARRSAGMVP